MKYTVALVAAATAVAANNGTSYTTEVVTAYTTYCPEATTITHGNKTYTVTSVSATRKWGNTASRETGGARLHRTRGRAWQSNVGHVDA